MIILFKHLDLEPARMETRLEKAWVFLVYISALALIVAGVLSMGFRLFSPWWFLGIFVGAFIINLAMLIVCCSKLNEK